MKRTTSFFKMEDIIMGEHPVIKMPEKTSDGFPCFAAAGTNRNDAAVTNGFQNGTGMAAAGFRFGPISNNIFQNGVPPALFLKTNDVLHVNRQTFTNVTQVFNASTKTLEISGDPLELTIECDYKTINVSGNCHRIFIVGICNTVNFLGNLNSVAFEGFSNVVNLLGSGFGFGDTKCYVWGDLASVKLGQTTGTVIYDNGPKPEKLEFPADLKEGRRRRITCRPTQAFDESLYFPAPQVPLARRNSDSVEEDEDWVDWEDNSNSNDSDML